MSKARRQRGENDMPKVKAEEKGGLCCPHCADSKFPCVNMEKQMRRESKESKERSGEGKGS